jgi:hypothetical protein
MWNAVGVDVLWKTSRQQLGADRRQMTMGFGDAVIRWDPTVLPLAHVLLDSDDDRRKKKKKKKGEKIKED